jgi:hypothetical protein
MRFSATSRRPIRGFVPSLIQNLLNQFGPEPSAIRTVTGEHILNQSMTQVAANQMGSHFETLPNDPHHPR